MGLSKKEKVIQMLLDNNLVEVYVRTLLPNNRNIDDICQDIWLIILELNDYGRDPINYIKGIIYKNCCCSHSDIYKRYIQYDLNRESYDDGLSGSAEETE